MKDNSPGRRAAVYWFADGLPDILFGATLLIFGVAGVLWQMYAPHRPVCDLLLMSLAFGLFYWKEQAALDFLKSHVTYPRTGYAQPPDEAPQPAVVTPLSLTPTPRDENATHFGKRTVMLMFWFFYISFTRSPPRWLAPLLMAALAVALFAANRDSERPFRWWSALLLALTGLVFLLGDVPPLLQPMLSVLMAGAWLAAQGLWTLIHYLRANPYPRTPEGVRV